MSCKHSLAKATYETCVMRRNVLHRGGRVARGCKRVHYSIVICTPQLSRADAARQPQASLPPSPPPPLYCIRS